MSRTSLTSLKKIKEPPLRGEQYSIKERAGEVSGLEKERDDLSKEIKRLGEIFFRLSRGVEVAKSTVREITSERLGTIEYIAREVSSDLEKQASVLKDKSKELDDRNVFLSELLGYVCCYAQIVEAEDVLNAQKEGVLDKRDGSSLKREKTSQKLKVKREEALNEAKSKLKSAKENEEMTNAKVKFMNNQINRTKKRIEDRSRYLKLKAKKLNSKSKNLKLERQRLKKMEARLLDKEATLVRSAKEVEKKAEKVGIVL